jgi:hypothetical protein
MAFIDAQGNIRADQVELIPGTREKEALWDKIQELEDRIKKLEEKMEG